MIKLSNQGGFTIMETLVSLFIILLILIGVYNLIILSVRLTADNAFYTEAIEIANQKMEYIRNLPYDDVGTLTGSPAGILPEFENINREGNYTIHTQVVFYDDPYDGTLSSSTDSVFVDYKIATIGVGWNGKYGPRDVTVFSKIIPNTEETLTGYGLLKLFVVDANGNPVSNSNVHVLNTSPVLDANYITNLDGELTLPLLPDFEGYEVTISKAGYGIDKTYTRDLINLNPSKPHVSIFDAAKTEESFSIDKLANLTIKTVSNNLPDNWPVSNNKFGENINVSSGIDINNFIYTAWEEEVSTSTSIKIHKHNNTGTAMWASPISISTSTFQKNPNIAVSKAGTQYIVWQDNSATLKQIVVSNSKRYVQNKTFFPEKKSEIISPVLSYLAYSPKNYFLHNYSYLPIFVKPNTSSNVEISLSSLVKKLKIKNALAQTSANIVQTKISSAENSRNYLQASFDNPPSDGNILIAVAIHRNNYAIFGLPYNSSGNFTEAIYSDSSWYMDVGIWYKIANAGEPSQVTLYNYNDSKTSEQDIDGGVMMLLEVSGLNVADPLDVTTSNDQTSSNSNTATTGNTAMSANTGFAISGIGFGDNNFNTPGSGNWTSGSSDSWSQTLWRDWSTGNDASLAIATMNITNGNNQSATLNLTGGGSEQRNSIMAVFNLAPSNSISVSSIESQISTTSIASLNKYLGGKFVITEEDSSRFVNSVSIHEKGTVDASSSLDNFKLYYDLDISAPYDCVDEQYNAGIDSQFGSASSFSSINGSSTITHIGGIQITTSQALCLYPVVDVLSSSNNGETVDVYINNPLEDISISSGIISQTSQIDLTGSTLLLSPAKIEQIVYRWRNDDGDESSATWNQSQNNPASTPIVSPLRIRFELKNSGGQMSDPFNYRIEYGEYTGSCSSITVWNSLPTDNSLHWKIVNSTNLTDSATTSNVSGGLTDENFNFKEGYVKDNSNLTPGISINSDEFTEVEYSIEATSNAQDKTYCFRLTNNGSTSSIDYIEYPIASITGDSNIFLSAYDSSGSRAWGIKKVNSDMTNFEQSNPIIALTENFGRPTTTIIWEDQRNGNDDIYAQSFDSDGNKLWSPDLQITSSSSDETESKIAFDSSDNMYIVWVNNEGSNKDIYINKYNLSGVPLLGDPINIVSSSIDEFSPDIAIDSSDNIYISWTENISGVYNILLAKYNSSLIKQWEINPNLSGISYNQSNSKIDINGSTIYSIWSDDREGNLDIYSQKISSDSTIIWSDDLRININTGSSIQTSPNILISSLGNPIGVWQDQRNSNFEIYATKYSDPGALTSVANVPLIITGTKQIGDSPVILEYENHITSGGTGEITLQVEWDVPGYSVNVNPASTTDTIILRNPIQPIPILPEENLNIILYVE